MDLKKTYSYFVVDNLKTTSIVYLVVTGVTLLIFLFANFMGESLALKDVVDLIPNYFTVAIVSFIISIVMNRSNDLICNQFGKSRKTAFISNFLVLFSIGLIFALIFSLLKSFFYSFELNEYLKYKEHLFNFNINNKQLLVGASAKYINRFSYLLYNFAYYSFLAIAFSILGIFIYSLWVRLEKLYRWIVFLLVPVIITYLTPKLIIFYISDSSRTIVFVNNIIKLFGLENGFSYQFIFVSTIIILIPMLIISYFIMLKKPLYGVKK